MKRLRLTAPGTETPDVGAYALGDWIAGATSTNQSLPYGWTRRDIGIDRFFSPAGHTATVRGNYYVSGGGDGWSKTSDSFHLASTKLAGDGSVTATLQHQEASNVAGAKAALMFRASESPTADFVALAVSPAAGVRWETRRSASVTPLATLLSPVSNAQLAPGTSYSLLADASVEGGVVTEVIFRVDGGYLAKGFAPPFTVNWTTPALNTGENSRTVVLSASALSHTGVLSSRSEVTVQIVRGNTTPYVTLTSPARGSRLVVGRPVTLRAAGGVPSGSFKDFVFRANGAYLSNRATAPYENTWTPTTPGEYTLRADIRDNSTPTVTVRSVDIPVTVISEEETTAPIVLRIERTGAVFSGFYSRDDGATWTSAGTVSVPAMPATALAGLAATTQGRSYLSTAIFNDVSINDLATPGQADGFTEWLRTRNPGYFDVSGFIHQVDAATGMPGMLQYALGVPASRAPAVSDQPTISVLAPDAQGRSYATISFVMPDDPLLGVIMEIQESVNLATWEPVDSGTNLLSKNALGDGRSRVTYRGNRLLETNAKTFLRLRVTRQ
jgi:hypothetical protein